MRLHPFSRLSRLFWFILTCLSTTASPKDSTSFQKAITKLESTLHGKIGVYALNTGNNSVVQYRGKERFPMGCTSKIMGVAAILKKSMREEQFLNKVVQYKKEDLESWSPITAKHVQDGLTILDLASAAITVSDNTAMNLLAHELGGIEAINTFARSLGNQDFQLDHGWPEEAKSGGPKNKQDSSTPSAMNASLEKLILGNELAPLQKKLFTQWLKNDSVGLNRIRAGVPKGWSVGDKTGTNFYYGIANDIAVIWPPHCAPLVLSIFTIRQNKNAKKREDILAKTTNLVLQEFAVEDQCLKSNLF